VKRCPLVGLRARDRFERAGFFKEVRRAGHDFQLLFAAKFRKRFLVQPDHRFIVSTHDEQLWRLHTRQCITREIGPSAARDHRIDPLPDFDRSYQRCASAGARSEIADAEIARFRLRDEPPRHFREPTRQQADVESQPLRDIVLDLLRGQQIEKQRAIARFADDSRDELIARTVPAAAAAVRENHDAV
jgi:hypothetical protein